jgi:exopolysaccharide production protein ExoQ
MPVEQPYLQSALNLRRGRALRRAPLRLRIDQAQLAVGAAVAGLTFIPMFGSLSALIFLMALGLLFISRRDASVDVLLRHWPILILPAYAMLSAFWSDYPSLTMRYSFQLMLTMIGAMLIASRVTPQQFLKILFIVVAAIIVASVLFGRSRIDGIAIGVFASKNAYAAHISIFLLAGVGIFLTRRSNIAMRLTGLIAIGVSPLLLLAAQGAGAIVSVAMALCVFPIILISAWLNITARRYYFSIAFVALLAFGLFAAVLGPEIIEATLVYFDKDPTITGRTDLWERGYAYIAERPLFGAGFQAFWVQDSGPAEELWAMFQIEARTGFHFHNTLITIAVELGIVGAVLTALLQLACLIATLRWAMLAPSALSAFYASFNVMLFCRSLVEVDIFYQFSLPTLVTVCSLMFASREVRMLKRRLPARRYARVQAPDLPQS